jgi:hypothetical protein
MRALCVLVVACGMAAGAAGGTSHGEPRIGALRPALSCEAPPLVRAAAVHAALHAIAGRAGRLRSARAPHGSPPAVALVAGWSLVPPRRATTGPALSAGGRRAERLARTGSARGPPIA